MRLRNTKRRNARNRSNFYTNVYKKKSRYNYFADEKEEDTKEEGIQDTISDAEEAVEQATDEVEDILSSVGEMNDDDQSDAKSDLESLKEKILELVAEIITFSSRLPSRPSRRTMKMFTTLNRKASKLQGYTHTLNFFCRKINRAQGRNQRNKFSAQRTRTTRATPRTPFSGRTKRVMPQGRRTLSDSVKRRTYSPSSNAFAKRSRIQNRKRIQEGRIKANTSFSRLKRKVTRGSNISPKTLFNTRRNRNKFSGKKFTGRRRFSDEEEETTESIKIDSFKDNSDELLKFWEILKDSEKETADVVNAATLYLIQALVSPALDSDTLGDKSLDEALDEFYDEHGESMISGMKEKLEAEEDILSAMKWATGEYITPNIDGVDVEFAQKMSSKRKFSKSKRFNRKFNSEELEVAEELPEEGEDVNNPDDFIAGEPPMNPEIVPSELKNEMDEEVLETSNITDEENTSDEEYFSNKPKRTPRRKLQRKAKANGKSNVNFSLLSKSKDNQGQDSLNTEKSITHIQSILANN